MPRSRAGPVTRRWNSGLSSLERWSRKQAPCCWANSSACRARAGRSAAAQSLSRAPSSVSSCWRREEVEKGTQRVRGWPVQLQATARAAAKCPAPASTTIWPASSRPLCRAMASIPQARASLMVPVAPPAVRQANRLPSNPAFCTNRSSFTTGNRGRLWKYSSGGMARFLPVCGPKPRFSYILDCIPPAVKAPRPVMGKNPAAPCQNPEKRH